MLILAKKTRSSYPAHVRSRGQMLQEGDLNQEKHHTTHLLSSYTSALLSLTELEATLGLTRVVTVTKRLILYKFV